MNERHLLSWIAPRGIVAAAISALFAIKLEAIGYQQAAQLVPLTYMVIIGTVLLQSSTAGLIARRLGVQEPEPRGFLIVGGGLVGQAIGEALQNNGFRVLLADPNWSMVQAAKVKGLPAYWGNPVSEHAERHLNLVGIGNLLALSEQVEMNALATQYYRLEFDPQRVYSIRQEPFDGGQSEAQVEFKHGGRTLFDDTVTLPELKRRVEEGGKISKTELTENFSFKDFLAQGKPRAVPLFAIDDADCVHVFSPDATFTPEAGWSLLALS
jgi:CPA1 family monovalent cation:H+ antiporter